jgi:uncharacterized protein (TIGR00730 family)
MSTQKKIVVFGGSECLENRQSFFYPIAYETGKLLAQAGFITANGGGPGLMDQTARGAQENGGETIGICLNLEGREHSKFLTHKEAFDHLRPRQEKLINIGDAYMAIPGGIGTFYEIFEVITLKRKNDIPETKPLILISQYFQECVAILHKMEEEGFLGVDANTLYQIVDTPLEAVSILKRFYEV